MSDDLFDRYVRHYLLKVPGWGDARWVGFVNRVRALYPGRFGGLPTKDQLY